MATIPFQERPEFLVGRDGEQRVADWLKDFGWYVIPSYDYSGENGSKAPKLQGLRNGYPVPDLDIAKSGARRWVEVKTKKTADWTRITRRLEHGIEHYDDYLRVAQETGTEAWLAVYELEASYDMVTQRPVGPDLLIQSFDKLGEPRRSTMNGKRMAYWPRASFDRFNICQRDAG